MTKMYRTLTIVSALLVCTAIGCSTAPEPKKEEPDQAYSELQARLIESERLNKRLDKKIGRLEQVIAVTQDRIEAQNLANQFQQHQPDPVPESRFSNGLSSHSPSRAARRAPGTLNRRPQRISLNGGPTTYEEPNYYYESEAIPENYSPEMVVITQDDFEAFMDKNPQAEQPAARPARSTQGGRRVAQPDVTDARLSVSSRPSAPSASPKATRPATPSRRTGGGGSLALYEEGLSFYRSGDFSRSLERFSEFLEQGPEESYLDNALYWIGESHYGLNNMPKSIHYFKRVIAEVPNGNKVPNAMLKMAMAYRNIGQSKTSRKILKSIVKKFPSTGPGQIAQRELEK